MCTFKPTASDGVIKTEAQGEELRKLWAKLKLLGCTQGGGYGNIEFRTPVHDYLLLTYSPSLKASLLYLDSLKEMGITREDLGI